MRVADRNKAYFWFGHYQSSGQSGGIDRFSSTLMQIPQPTFPSRPQYICVLQLTVSTTIGYGMQIHIFSLLQEHTRHGKVTCVSFYSEAFLNIGQLQHCASSNADFRDSNAFCLAALHSKREFFPVISSNGREMVECRSMNLRK